MKKIIALLLALVLVLALAACGEKPADTGDDAAPAGDDAASGDDAAAGDDAAGGDDAASGDDAAAPAGYTGSADFDWSAYSGVDFEIMWQETDDTQIQIVKEYAMPALQEISDEYGINFTWVGNVDQSYTTLAATGELSDVWFGNVTLDMIQSDIMLNLTPYLTVDSYLEDTYATPGFFFFNGNIWSLSTGVDSFYNGVLYYNRTLFAECGIEDDLSTFDKMVAACETLMANGYMGLTISWGPWQHFGWSDAVLSVDVEAYRALISGDKTAFAVYGDAFAGSFDEIRTLLLGGYTPAALNVHETADSIADFTAGDCGMLYVQSWNNGSVQKGAEETGFDVGVAWWPVSNTGYQTGDYISSWGSPLSGWCAKADTEYPELAVEVIKVINRAEAARHLAAGLGTNHVQEGTPTPTNDVEAQRFELRANVIEFMTNWNETTCDATTFTEFKDVVNTSLSEDDVDTADLVARLDAAWQTNTFFD